MQAIDLAFQILDYLSTCPEDAGVLEVSRAAGVNQTTVHRVLSALKQRGAVIQDPRTKRYRLGFLLLALGHRAIEKTSAFAVALPYMLTLNQTTRETIAMCLLVGHDRVYVGEVRSPEPVHYAVEVGRPFPLYLGAPGKAILAYMPDREVGAVLQMAERAGQSVERLQAELAEIRRAGVTFSSGERVRGSSALAAPIFARGGIVIGSLVIATPTDRLHESDSLTIGKDLAAAARAISQELGH